MKALSPYKIHWVMLIPTRLNATKSDAQALGCERFDKQLLFKHFLTAEAAEEWVENHRKCYAITKPYNAYIITDKQYTMLTALTREAVMQVLTSKQRESVVTVSYR